MTTQSGVKTDEAAQLLGIELARFRFLELHCLNFLSPSHLEFPCRYSPADLKLLSAANRLLDEGVAPGALKFQLARMLADSSWDMGMSGSPKDGLNVSTLLAVSSGKGGVGKSNVALNLGVEFVRLGLRTAVLDADFGVANLHLMAGLKTDRTLRHVISGQCGIEEIITSVSEGPDIVPGSSGIFELANLPASKRQMLLAELKKLESRYEIIIIDTAAGVAAAVIDFVASSDFTLVVTTPEATAITDAYALIKLGLQRNPCSRMGIVANRVKSADAGAATLGRISACTRRFLGHSPLELGCIWEDSNVRRSVNECVPLAVRYPQSRASVAIRKLARTLREKGVISPRGREKEGGFNLFSIRCAQGVMEAAEKAMG